MVMTTVVPRARRFRGDGGTLRPSSTPNAFHVQGASVGVTGIRAWLLPPASSMR